MIRGDRIKAFQPQLGIDNGQLIGVFLRSGSDDIELSESNIGRAVQDFFDIIAASLADSTDVLEVLLFQSGLHLRAEVVGIATGSGTGVDFLGRSRGTTEYS